MTAKAERDGKRWEKAVSAAYLIELGMEQKDAAAVVGVTDRTVRRWKSDKELWRSALDEAHSRWLSGVVAQARARLTEKVSSADASDELVMKVLEKTVAEFADQPKRHHVAVAARVEVDSRDPREILAAKLAEISGQRESIGAAVASGELPNMARALPPALHELNDEDEDDE